MSAAWITVGVLLAAAAVALMLRGSRAGRPGCRWFAATAALWGAAFAAQGAGTGSVMPTGVELTPADLLALVSLPLAVMGMLRLARPSEDPGTSLRARVADSFLLGLSLLSIGWIVLLRSAYVTTGVGPGSFAVVVIHPLADVVALAGTLWLAVRAGRRAVAPYLALCATTVGDFLAVQARATALHPGALPQLAWLLGICLLGVAAVWPAESAAAAARPTATTAGAAAAQPAQAAGPDPRLTAFIALAAVAAAALVTFIFAVADWGHNGSLPLLLTIGLVVALIVRITGLLGQEAAMSAHAFLSGNQFQQLAERTSDSVLLCDAVGVVTFASHAVTQFGYQPDQLTGVRVAELVHPDDLPDAERAMGAVAAREPAQARRLACRIRSADGTWRHVEVAISRYTGEGPEDLLLVTARDVSDQVALRRQVTHLTFHDGLTGLPNRSYLEERAKDVLASRRQAASPQGQTGAIFVDLDGFTAINDSVGHGAGDVLLAQAGRRLRGLVPGHDTVARWGGDEFAVLVESAASPQEIVDVAERLAGAIAGEPFAIAGREISITASIGVAFADTEVPEHLLRNADLAMSRAKDSGGGRVEVFAAHMHADLTRRLELAGDLRLAVADGSLGIAYQPVAELATGRITNVEALFRWPRDGQPAQMAELLSVAEDSGLIVPIGNWLLREACQQVAKWRESGWQVRLSVNLSLRQVSSAGLAGSVLAALDQAGLARSALTLEMTERVLIDAGEPVLGALDQLRRVGVRLAIDDFGTGYASLAYLRQLPVDVIKISPSFVAGLGTDGILAMLTRTIVRVGHDLGIEIVAEGIERPEQLELLRAMGCGLGQGALVARPMTAGSVEELAVYDGQRVSGLVTELSQVGDLGRARLPSGEVGDPGPVGMPSGEAGDLGPAAPPSDQAAAAPAG